MPQIFDPQEYYNGSVFAPPPLLDGVSLHLDPVEEEDPTLIRAGSNFTPRRASCGTMVLDAPPPQNPTKIVIAGSLTGGVQIAPPVVYDPPEAPGTLAFDPDTKRLTWVQPSGGPATEWAIRKIVNGSPVEIGRVGDPYWDIPAGLAAGVYSIDVQAIGPGGNSQ